MPKIINANNCTRCVHFTITEEDMFWDNSGTCLKHDMWFYKDGGVDDSQKWANGMNCLKHRCDDFDRGEEGSDE